MTAARSMVQLLAGFAEGDAISNESRALDRLFRQMGFVSRRVVVDGRIAPGAADQCEPLSAWRGAPDDIVLYHYGIASPATDAFARAPGRKVLIYHNITPAGHFAGFDDALAARLREARRELAAVARAADAVWADSEFNAAELRGLGVANARVFPLLFAKEDAGVPPDPAVLARFAAPMKNLLFVGRMAPNKSVEDLILAFAWFNRTILPQSRLILVGSERSCPRYYAMLRLLAGTLDLPNVCFEGYASPSGLAACYRVADVFVSASRHEGYCLPLVEAMVHGVPVVARAAGGTPEAMGGAGVLFDDAGPAELAELIRRVLEDAPLRAAVLDSQARRVQALLGRPAEAELRALLREVAGD